MNVPRSVLNELRQAADALASCKDTDDAAFASASEAKEKHGQAANDSATALKAHQKANQAAQKAIERVLRLLSENVAGDQAGNAPPSTSSAASITVARPSIRSRK
jgi:hypothetical protein